jgi:DNA-directed RNA polymerase alpha subunit
MEGRPIDPRLEGFRQYIDHLAAEQDKRPYGERQDIERVFGICDRGRQIYQELIELPSSSTLDPELRRKYNTPIGNLNFSVRTINCLLDASPKGYRVETVGQLVERTQEELLSIRNFGRLSLREVTRELDGMGLSLRSKGSQT